MYTYTIYVVVTNLVTYLYTIYVCSCYLYTVYVVYTRRWLFRIFRIRVIVYFPVHREFASRWFSECFYIIWYTQFFLPPGIHNGFFLLKFFLSVFIYSTHNFFYLPVHTMFFFLKKIFECFYIWYTQFFLSPSTHNGFFFF